ncbi:hypothetical protein D1B33_06340 [Lysinibacillus yapensis]|uniref:Competence protein ComGF n=1 Tax=Ureibacillus yapensis TaxID=2304605 RepID=A0A396SAZ1_9BACL|nr:competence type IV pilus minor pilin ComGF [Lysinibacillus yapensis]RHW38494.1 hypothetical protein D1B33_06340 [Lysinibacillus yapensis]
MHYSKRNKHLNGKGYTLLEALFNFVVFIMLSQIVLLVLAWIQQMNATFLTNEGAAWELFIQDMQQYFVEVENVSLSSDSTSIDIYYPIQTIYTINQSGDVLRLKKNDGNVPLLIGIKSVFFKWDNQFISIEATFQNGIKKERKFFVQKSQE